MHKKQRDCSNFQLIHVFSFYSDLACPPSALLCAKEKDKPSEFAMQGIDAHTLCEHKLKLALGQQSKDPTEDLTFFDEEMTMMISYLK